MSVSIVIVGVIGLILGAALSALAMAWRGARSSAADHARMATLEADRAALERRLTEEAAALGETIQRVSTEMILQGTDRLAREAAARFEEVAGAVAKDLDLREERFRSQVDPLKGLLEQYKTNLAAMELNREGAYQSVHQQLEALKASGEGLRQETRSLVTALRTPHTRGRWGEMQLRRVVEMAGMLEHCDFVEQSSRTTDEGLARPDMVVTMPGGGVVVIDAKAPLAAYLDAIESAEETRRQGHLVTHARQLRDHVDALSKKAYWEQFATTPEFVVCFVPGDGLLAAAFEADHTLVEHAMESRVLLAGPTSLMALLQTIGFGWRQEAMAENAREVQALGQELYKRIATMSGHLDRLGRTLERAVGGYNELVGSAEGRVLVTARRFQELGVVGTGAGEVVNPGSIDITPRALRASELLEGPDGPEGEAVLHEDSAHAEHPAASHHEPLHLVGDDGE